MNRISGKDSNQFERSYGHSNNLDRILKDIQCIDRVTDQEQQNLRQYMVRLI